MDSIAMWRATYTPGNWVVLAGPRSLVVMRPAPASASRLLNDLWDDVAAAASVHDLARTLAAFRVDAMPAFGAFFWSDGGMQSLVRGVRVIDPRTGDVVADGEGVQTWREVGLGHLTLVRIDLESVDQESVVQLPLMVGCVLASALQLDASDEARISLPVAAVATDGDVAPDSAREGDSAVPSAAAHEADAPDLAAGMPGTGPAEPSFGAYGGVVAAASDSDSPEHEDLAGPSQGALHDQDESETPLGEGDEDDQATGGAGEGSPAGRAADPQAAAPADEATDGEPEEEPEEESSANQAEVAETGDELPAVELSDDVPPVVASAEALVASMWGVSDADAVSPVSMDVDEPESEAAAESEAVGLDLDHEASVPPAATSLEVGDAAPADAPPLPAPSQPSGFVFGRISAEAAPAPVSAFPGNPASSGPSPAAPATGGYPAAGSPGGSIGPTVAAGAAGIAGTVGVPGFPGFPGPRPQHSPGSAPLGEPPSLPQPYGQGSPQQEYRPGSPQPGPGQIGAPRPFGPQGMQSGPPHQPPPFGPAGQPPTAQGQPYADQPRPVGQSGQPGQPSPFGQPGQGQPAPGQGGAGSGHAGPYGPPPGVTHGQPGAFGPPPGQNQPGPFGPPQGFARPQGEPTGQFGQPPGQRQAGAYGPPPGVGQPAFGETGRPGPFGPPPNQGQSGQFGPPPGQSQGQVPPWQTGPGATGQPGPGRPPFGTPGQPGQPGQPAHPGPGQPPFGTPGQPGLGQPSYGGQPPIGAASLGSPAPPHPYAAPAALGAPQSQSSAPSYGAPPPSSYGSPGAVPSHAWSPSAASPSLPPQPHQEHEDDDVDGGTIFSTSLAQSHKPAAAAAGGGFILAGVCPQGHPNPPGEAHCRRCGGPVDTANPKPVARPTMATLVTSAGARANLIDTVLIGRSPSAQHGDTMPILLPVPSPNNDISRTHVRVAAKDWEVIVTDISTNGTMVITPGEPPTRLNPGSPMVVPIGTVIDLGDGARITVNNPD